MPNEIRRKIEEYAINYSTESAFEKREQLALAEAFTQGGLFVFYEMRHQIQKLERELFQARMENSFPNVEHDRALRGKFRQ